MTDAEDAENINTPSVLSDEPVRIRPAKWKVTLVISLILMIQVGNWIASGFIATLAVKHPMWLLLLQPTTRNLLLVATHMTFWSFFIVAVLRRQVPHPLWFFIGRWYGESGIRWVSKRVPEVGRILTTIEDAFPKWGPVICALYPHPAVCALAGASKMKFGWFLVYTFIGIIGYVSLAWAFGDWLSPVSDALLRFGSRYLWQITVFTLLTTAFMIWQGFRNHKIESIHQMESDLEGRKSADTKDE